jgi:hypothetical protein
VIDLSKTGGNLHVYFTVRRVDVFPRYSVPVITAQGSAPPVIPVTPPATGSTPAPTGSAPAPTGGTGQDLSAGTVVAHGSFDVHDFYRATVVAAFTFSTIKDQTVKSKTITSGQANDGTPCSTTSPCSQPFLDKGSPLASVVVGVNYYLSKQGHDTSPASSIATSARRWGYLGDLQPTDSIATSSDWDSSQQKPYSLAAVPISLCRTRSPEPTAPVRFIRAVPPLEDGRPGPRAHTLVWASICRSSGRSLVR